MTLPSHLQALEQHSAAIAHPKTTGAPLAAVPQTRQPHVVSGCFWVQKLFSTRLTALTFLVFLSINYVALLISIVAWLQWEGRRGDPAA